MCLRNASAPPNAFSQCVCATQCVFTMRLRLPCVCAFQCVFTQCVFRLRLRLLMRLRLLGLFLTNASSQCGCVFRSFTTLPQDAAIHLFIYPLIHQFIHSSVHSNHFFIQSFMQPIQFNSIHSVHSTHSIHSIQLISQTFIQSFIRPSIHSSNMHAFIHRFFLSFISFKFSLYPPTCMFIHLILGPL